MGSDLGDASIGGKIDALAGAIAELESRLAEDLLVAVRTYMNAERRLVALDEAAGQNVAHRVSRLTRLQHFLESLERERSGSVD